MRTIAVVTGTRAEYGYLKPLMQAIEQDNTLQLIPIITGMHLLPDFGDTQKLVKQDFPTALTIDMPLYGDQLKDMTLYLSSGIKNFTEYFYQHPPDILVVLGDRTESLAAALTAVYQNIPIAHLNGGDVSGTTLDESIRHAITKLAHIHFAHTQSNAERIIKMGEDKYRVYITGALTIDAIQQIPLTSKKNIFNSYHLDPKKPTVLAVILLPHLKIKDIVIWKNSLTLLIH